MVMSHHNEIKTLSDFLFSKLRHIIPFVLAF